MENFLLSFLDKKNIPAKALVNSLVTLSESLGSYKDLVTS